MPEWGWKIADVLVYPVVIGGILGLCWKYRWSKMAKVNRAIRMGARVFPPTPKR
jgi:hypothetical protein